MSRRIVSLLKRQTLKKCYMELRLSYEKRGEIPREREWERENPERMIGRVGWLVGSGFSWPIASSG